MPQIHSRTIKVRCLIALPGEGERFQAQRIETQGLEILLEPEFGGDAMLQVSNLEYSGAPMDADKEAVRKALDGIRRWTDREGNEYQERVGAYAAPKEIASGLAREISVAAERAAIVAYLRLLDANKPRPESLATIAALIEGGHHITRSGSDRHHEGTSDQSTTSPSTTSSSEEES